MSTTAPAAEPQLSAEGSVGSGGSMLRVIRDGRLPPPPAAQLLGLDLVDVRHGHVVFNFDAATRFDNGQAAIHGGILAAVLDFAVSTGVDIGTTAVTSSLNVTFIRPVHPDNGSLSCIGTLVHIGRRSAIADATSNARSGGRRIIREVPMDHVRVSKRSRWSSVQDAAPKEQSVVGLADVSRGRCRAHSARSGA
jgi:uncharacterized protein (TIGR00369 family)